MGFGVFRRRCIRSSAEMYAAGGVASPSGRIRSFITCADSRIDPNLKLPGSGTGEVFVTRNIGNMVPAYGDMLGGVSGGRLSLR